MEDRTTDYFNANYLRYDRWYDTHRKEYNDQIEFLRTIIPSSDGIEIGVGTGRIAAALNIRFGLDRSPEMLKLARRRGVKTFLGDAYDTKLPDKAFDYSLFYMTLCFLKQPEEAIKEAYRISKKVISVILDRECAYVKEIMKDLSGFYSSANFFTEREIVNLYTSADLKVTGKIEKDLKLSNGILYRLIAITGT